MVQTRSQAKASRLHLPEVHGGDKGIDPHIRPERQTVKPTVTQTDIRMPTYKPRVGQGRTGIRKKVEMVTPPQHKQVIPSISEKQGPEIMTQPQVIPQTEHVPSTQNAHRQPMSPKIVARQVPLCPDPYLKPPPRLPDLKEHMLNLMDLDMDNDINIDFEEISPYQEGIITETYQRPDNSYVKNHQN